MGSCACELDRKRCNQMVLALQMPCRGPAARASSPFSRCMTRLSSIRSFASPCLPLQPSGNSLRRAGTATSASTSHNGAATGARATSTSTTHSGAATGAKAASASTSRSGAATGAGAASSSVSKPNSAAAPSPDSESSRRT